MNEECPPTLVIPDLPDDCDVLTAALEYAKAGWYVGPLAPGTKNPGSILGDKWHHQTSRDPQVIYDWYIGRPPGMGVFLHVGRSGGVVFDIDHIEMIPDVLAECIQIDQPPYQTTRPDEPGRRHVVYTCPPGRQLGNSKGELRGGWGEVRGLNGVIVVPPTPHPEGGRYEWRATGACPVLPPPLSAALPDGRAGQDAASDAHVAARLQEWSGQARPDLIFHALSRFDDLIEAGESRHMAAVDAACWIAREARAGFYPLAPIMLELRNKFVEYMGMPNVGSGRQIDPSMAWSEFDGIVAWAISQAEAEDIDALIARINRPFKALDSSTLIPPDYQPRPPEPIVYEGSAEALALMDPESDERQRVFDYNVSVTMEKYRISDEARRRLRSEGVTDPPTAVSFAELMTHERKPITYRVDRMIPSNTKVILSAQRKTGKTTMMGNLIRSLVDGAMFLDRYPTKAVDDGTVVLLDFEMNADMITEWLRDQDIKNPDAIIVNTLRGHARSFDIVDTRTRNDWVAKLKALNCKIIIIDCLRPILDAIGLDESHDAGVFLNALDTLLSDAEINECVLVHHAGHNGERARGDSRLRDWPDVEWRMIRDNERADPMAEADPNADRFFITDGRDVEKTNMKILYDPETRHMSLESTSLKDNRAEKKRAERLANVMRFLKEHGRSTTSTIHSELGGEKKTLVGILDKAVRDGLVEKKRDGESRTAPVFWWARGLPDGEPVKD